MSQRGARRGASGRDVNQRHPTRGANLHASHPQQLLCQNFVSGDDPMFFPQASPAYAHRHQTHSRGWWPHATQLCGFSQVTPRFRTTTYPSLHKHMGHRPASCSDTDGGLSCNDRERGDVRTPESKTSSFKHLRRMVQAFVNDPAAKELSFPPTLSPSERQKVHNVAQMFGLFHRSSGSGNNRFLTLRKNKDVGEDPKLEGVGVVGEVQMKTTQGYQGAQRLPDDYIRPKTSDINRLVRPLLGQMFHDLKMTADRSSRTRQLVAVQPGLESIPPSKFHYQRYEELQSFRKTLPAFRQQDAIVDAVKGSDVVVISGDTGCGKTTQIPQILYDAGIFHKEQQIVCTQPRRVSALSVSQRVSEERGEACGNSCGYIIRFDNVTSNATKIVYMTTGILLRRLRTDPDLSGVSCVVVDEVHERDVETDFCLLLLRDRIVEQQRNPGAYANNIKVVVMSATVQVDKIIAYFSNVIVGNKVPLIKIPGTLHPVEEYFMEDVVQWLRLPESTLQPVNELSNAIPEKGATDNSEERMCCSVYEKIKKTVDAKLNFEPQARVSHDMVVKLISYIHSNSGNLSESILVFLPGWQDISRVANVIQRSNVCRELSVLQLHSSLTAEEQQRVFRRPPRVTGRLCCRPTLLRQVLRLMTSSTSLTVVWRKFRPTIPL